MEAVNLTVIGSGDAFGSGGRLNTCFHIRTPGINFLLDCGATALQGLKKNNLTTDDVDCIFISHFHGDHYGGLPYFLVDAATFRRKKPLNIYSPPGCREKILQLLPLLYPGTEVLKKLDVQFTAYQSQQEIRTADFTLTAYPVVHTDAALPHGLRIDIAGKRISFSGDTEWTDNLIFLSEKADLFICECNFYELRVHRHLNYQILKEKTAALSCRKILLTHFDNEMLKNLHHVDLPLAEDGMIIEI